MNEAGRHVQALGARAVEVQYESFLADPHSTLKSLPSFCGLNANDEELLDAAKSVMKTRAFAYRAVPELRAFAAQVSERLAAYGY